MLRTSLLHTCAFFTLISDSSCINSLISFVDILLNFPPLPLSLCSLALISHTHEVVRLSLLLLFPLYKPTPPAISRVSYGRHKTYLSRKSKGFISVFIAVNGDVSDRLLLVHTRCVFLVYCHHYYQVFLIPPTWVFFTICLLCGEGSRVCCRPVSSWAVLASSVCSVFVSWT